MKICFFRVKLNNYSTTTKEFIPALTIYSQPIKVISKPDQIKKRNGNLSHDPKPRSKRPRGEASITQYSSSPVQSLLTQAQGQIQPLAQNQVQTSNSAAHSLAAHILNGVPSIQHAQTTTVAPPVQHTPIINTVMPEVETHIPTQPVIVNADQLIDVIKKIENTMVVQAHQLERACQKIEKLEKIQTNGNSYPASVENAFEAMMKAYSNLKPNERVDKIRKLTKCGSLKEAERLSEFLRALWLEGIEVVEPAGIPETPPDESMNQVDSPLSDEQPYQSDVFGGNSHLLNSQYSGQQNYGGGTKIYTKALRNHSDFISFLLQPRLNSSLSREDPFSDLAE